MRPSSRLRRSARASAGNRTTSPRHRELRERIDEGDGRLAIQLARLAGEGPDEGGGALEPAGQGSGPVLGDQGQEVGDPAPEALGVGRALRVAEARRVGLLGVRGARPAGLRQERQRGAVGRSSPGCLGPRQQPRGLPGRRPILEVDAEVAGLEHPPKRAGGEPARHPVAEGDERATGPREDGRDARPHGHRPLVALRPSPRRARHRPPWRRRSPPGPAPRRTRRCGGRPLPPPPRGRRRGTSAACRRLAPGRSAP